MWENNRYYSFTIQPAQPAEDFLRPQPPGIEKNYPTIMCYANTTGICLNGIALPVMETLSSVIHYLAIIINVVFVVYVPMVIESPNSNSLISQVWKQLSFFWNIIVKGLMEFLKAGSFSFKYIIGFLRSPRSLGKQLQRINTKQL